MIPDIPLNVVLAIQLIALAIVVVYELLQTPPASEHRGWHKW